MPLLAGRYTEGVKIRRAGSLWHPGREGGGSRSTRESQIGECVNWKFNHARDICDRQ